MSTADPLDNKISTTTLRLAYSNGFFPMWNEDTHTMEWHNPELRAIFLLNRIKVSKSLRQALRRNNFVYTVDVAFQNVIRACSERDDCWINEDIIESYTELHKKGLAHSFEVWENSNLVGGLYGVALGGTFCGESMFSRVTEASKCAFIYSCVFLSLCDFDFVDSQYLNNHTESLGAFEISKEEYLHILRKSVQRENCFDIEKATLIDHPLSYVDVITGNKN